MEVMDFSAFVNILFKYRKPYDDGRYPGHAEFIKILFDALIPDDVYERGDLKENPIYGYKKRMLEYIFTGERHIDPEKAAPVKRVMDMPTFEEYFEDFSEDGLISLSGDINRYGFETTSTDVVKSCASIMMQLVEHIADGLPEAVTQIDYKAREKGKRHVKDIVPTTLEYRDGRFDIKGEVITIDMSKYSDEEMDQTLRYVQALYEAYESRLKRKIDASNVDTMPEEMQENFTEQNRAFYYADSIRHNIEEMFYEGEEEFKKIKDNEWMFIRRTYRKPYDDGFERLEAVLDRAMETDLNSSVLANIRNLIDNLMKEGICQIMVNDGKIISWVTPRG
ncbi:MAG: hypothetical protein J6N76_02225 [Lachnospiraceae bacterium]|nr:hypothetical protein [Lachnospiraceae bacterium]